MWIPGSRKTCSPYQQVLLCSITQVCFINQIRVSAVGAVIQRNISIRSCSQVFPFSKPFLPLFVPLWTFVIQMLRRWWPKKHLLTTWKFSFQPQFVGGTYKLRLALTPATQFQVSKKSIMPCTITGQSACLLLESFWMAISYSLECNQDTKLFSVSHVQMQKQKASFFPLTAYKKCFNWKERSLHSLHWSIQPWYMSRAASFIKKMASLHSQMKGIPDNYIQKTQGLILPF